MNTSSKIPGLFRRLTYKIPIFRSLKAYIFLLMLIIGIVPSDIMRLGILNNYEERAVNLRGSDVASQYRIIANHLVNYNYLQNPTSDVVNAELEQMSNLYDGRVLIINSNFRIVKDTYAMSEGKTMISEEVIKCFRGESTTRYDKTNGYIEMTVPITERAREVLEQVGLGDKLKNRPNQLSGGQQQRVSIARALVRNPPVILADEPTGALDSHTGREVLGLLQQLHKQGHTVVLITHDNSIAVQADRIIRLEDGRVVYDGDSHAPEAMVQPTLLPETPEKEEQA